MTLSYSLFNFYKFFVYRETPYLLGYLHIIFVIIHLNLFAILLKVYYNSFHTVIFALVAIIINKFIVLCYIFLVVFDTRPI